MKNHLILVLTMSLLLVSCTYTLDRNLGNGYLLVGYDQEAVLYKHVSDKEDEQILLGGIIDYKFDNDFILVYRHITEKVLDRFNDHPFSERMRGGGNVQYWIIQKHNNIIAGPFSKVEFLLKRIDLNVSSKLHLSEE